MAPSTCTKTYKLNDGNIIPAVGFGTWQAKAGQCEEAVKNALAAKYRHIDTAAIYGNEDEVGNAIRDLGVRREHIFLTTKLWNDRHQDAEAALDESLKKLKTDYVDLYLLHAPFIKKETHGFDLKEAWQSLEKAVHDGLTKNIGVSNFSVDDLKEVLEVAKIKPVVNQIEFNAYLQNQTPGVVEFSQQNGILVEAYSPLGPIVKGEPGEFTEYLETLGSKYSKSASQVLLRWVIQKNVLPVTTSAKEERIAQFVDLFDFKLADEEVKKITDLGAKHPVLRQYWTTEYAKYD